MNAKKYIFSATFIIIFTSSYAQWQTVTSGINYTAGNVAIGTTPSPNFKLNILGEINVSRDFPYLQLHSTSWGSSSYFQNGVSATGSANGHYLIFQNPVGKGFNFRQGTFNALSINTVGNVGIGTNSQDQRLTVNGKIKCEELEVVVDVPADYVFEKEYQLMPLEEVAQYVGENKHLPGIPSAAEIKEDGWQVGEMNNKMLEKIEELTLYILQQEQEMALQAARLKMLEEEITALKNQ